MGAWPVWGLALGAGVAGALEVEGPLATGRVPLGRPWWLFSPSFTLRFLAWTGAGSGAEVEGLGAVRTFAAAT